MGRFCFTEQNKKKSPDSSRAKLNFKKNKIYKESKGNIPPTFPDRSVTSVLKNNNTKNYNVEHIIRKLDQNLSTRIYLLKKPRLVEEP